MPVVKVNGVHIFYELTGTNGDPLVFVHGSWSDHATWDLVTGELAKTFLVLTYDRRGHSLSERLPGSGLVAEDVDDLVAMVEQFALSPAHIVGNSFGSSIVLKAAIKRPDIFRSMIIHEPPLFPLLHDNTNAQAALHAVNGAIKKVLDLVAAGEMENAAKQFMNNIAMGPGAWEQLPGKKKETYIYNAPTWYDELQDPECLQIDLRRLSFFNKPTLLSVGSESPSFFPLVIDKLKDYLPMVTFKKIEGAGHVPYASHPDTYIDMVKDFVDQQED
ncbi:MAG TPA: alpha/beta hydrolase [Agriterribacter sp.]|nr:alpha/beta hydrolase [Agriterribacter sp.]